MLYKLNPFKIISNIENEIVEFRKMDIKDAIGAAFFYVIVLSFIGFLFIKNNANSSLKMLILNSIMALAIFAVTIILFYWWYVIAIIDEKDIYEKNLKKFTIKNVLYLTIAVLGFRIISNDLVVFILSPFSKVLMPKFMLKAINETIQISSLVYVCITGPAMEEFVFRGVILAGLLKKYSVKKSIVISALLFGIIHLNGIQVINAFFLGIFIGYIYVKTKSIYLCMYFHILFNALEFIFIYLPKIHNLFVTILFAIIGFIFIIYGIKKIDNFEIVN